MVHCCHCLWFIFYVDHDLYDEQKQVPQHHQLTNLCVFCVWGGSDDSEDMWSRCVCTCTPTHAHGGVALHPLHINTQPGPPLPSPLISHLLGGITRLERGHCQVVKNGIQNTNTKPCTQHRHNCQIHKLKANHQFSKQIVVTVGPHTQPVGQCVDQGKKGTVEPTTTLFEEVCEFGDWICFCYCLLDVFQPTSV